MILNDNKLHLGSHLSTILFQRSSCYPPICRRFCLMSVIKYWMHTNFHRICYAMVGTTEALRCQHYATFDYTTYFYCPELNLSPRVMLFFTNYIYFPSYILFPGVKINLHKLYYIYSSYISFPQAILYFRDLIFSCTSIILSSAVFILLGSLTLKWNWTQNSIK